MKFDPRELSVLCYANGFTLWHYKAASVDALDTDYFRSEMDLISAHDMILVSGNGACGFLHVLADITTRRVV